MALVEAAVILYAIYEYGVCVCGAWGVWDAAVALAAAAERAGVEAVIPLAAVRVRPALWTNSQ